MDNTRHSSPYDKANSLRELQGAGGDRDTVVERIRALAERLAAGVETAPHQPVLDRVFQELLHGTATGPGGLFDLRPHVVAELARIPDEKLARYLTYRFRYDRFPQTHELDAFPPCLQIEPTSICNYRCVFCYQTDPSLTKPANGHMGLMSVDMFRRIIDEAEGQCEAVTLASRGEPLMARGIGDMLAYVGGKFLAFKVNTNAWFLDDAKSHTLLQADINTVVFSADAAAEPLYSQLRVNGQLERVRRNIERFHEIRATQYSGSRTLTRVSGVRFTDSQSMDDMEHFWGGLVDQVAFVDYNPWENSYQRPMTGVAAPCSDLWRRMFVWWDGRMNPCDVDYLSTLAIGHKRQSVAEAWRSPAYETLRRMHTEGRRCEVGPCNRCTVV